MFIQIVIGLTVVILSVIIQVIFIEFIAGRLVRRYGSKPDSNVSFFEFVLSLSIVNLRLLLGLLTIVTLWAVLLLSLGIYNSMEESFYFSLVAFTTLGFGDVILPDKWRILAGFIATNGFIIFGLNTAVVLEVIIRMRGNRREQSATPDK